MHVGFLLLLGFAPHRQPRSRSAAGQAPGSGRSASLGFLTGLYNWVFYADLIHRSGFLTTPDLIVGAVADRAGLRRRAAADGPAADDHVRRLPRLLLPRPVSAAALDPSRLRLRADRRLFRLRHRRHLRHAGLRLGRLHLHLRRLRRLPRTRRHDRAVQRRRARPGRLLARRPGAGLRALLRADGHHLRLRRRQCRGERPVHHPADEALRLPLRLRRRASRRRRRWAARSCRRSWAPSPSSWPRR